jgi:hypothetical protein
MSLVSNVESKSSLLLSFICIETKAYANFGSAEHLSASSIQRQVHLIGIGIHYLGIFGMKMGRRRRQKSGIFGGKLFAIGGKKRSGRRQPVSRHRKPKTVAGGRQSLRGDLMARRLRGFGGHSGSGLAAEDLTQLISGG